MKTYSQDFRERVVESCDAGDSTREEIAEQFGVSTSWIRRLLQRRRESGSVAAHKRGGRRPSKFSGRKLEKLKELLDAQPDATLAEFRDQCGVKASLTSVFRALDRLGARRKKSP
jgi:transposase